MKSIFRVLAISLTLIIYVAIFSKPASAQRSRVSFQLFYDQLSPYGEWVDYPDYGYVWIPDVGSDFEPYSTDGHWILTNYGWTWASDYDWGWAPFHYGRWDYDNYYGWFWVPDTDWAPAWVNWRRANGYYGWSPMEPGLSISISFGRPYNRNNDHWTFVRYRDIDRPYVNRYSVNRTYHSWMFRNSIVINKTYVDRQRNTTYVYGPSRADVQKVTGRKFNPVTIRENTKPGHSLSNGQLRMYRPEVTKNNARGQRSVPSRIVNLKEVKRPSERKGTNQPRNINPSGINKREQQPSNVRPQNNNNNAKPVQPRNANPSQNNRREQRPKTVNLQNNNNVRPEQPRNANPSQNNRREQRPNTVNPQNNNNVRPEQPRNANSSQNNRRERQPANVNPQNSNNNATPVEPRNPNPSQNNRRERQPNNVNPQNSNNPTPVQPRNANPSQNNKREQQPNTVRQSNNNKNEQPRESRSEQNKKRKD